MGIIIIAYMLPSVTEAVGHNGVDLLNLIGVGGVIIGGFSNINPVIPVVLSVVDIGS
jgi:hypothetical protein